MNPCTFTAQNHSNQEFWEWSQISWKSRVGSNLLQKLLQYKSFYFDLILLIQILEEMITKCWILLKIDIFLRQHLSFHKRQLTINTIRFFGTVTERTLFTSKRSNVSHQKSFHAEKAYFEEPTWFSVWWYLYDKTVEDFRNLRKLYNGLFRWKPV